MSEGPDKLPFAAHRRYYVALKLVLLAIAVALAIRYFAS